MNKYILCTANQLRNVRPALENGVPVVDMDTWNMWALMVISLADSFDTCDKKFNAAERTAFLYACGYIDDAHGIGRPVAYAVREDWVNG